MQDGAPRVNRLIEDTHYDLRVPLSGADVRSALTDFGPMRPQIWPETSHPRVYRVHRLGAQEAEVTEGTPATWSRERYDWSDPGIITLTQLDSNVSQHGFIRYRIVEDGNASVVECDRHREFYGGRGWVAGALMKAFGTSILRRQLRSGIERSIRLRAARDEWGRSTETGCQDCGHGSREAAAIPTHRSSLLAQDAADGRASRR